MYEYKVTKPMLPPAEQRRHADTPIMNNEEMEWWLNEMDNDGWELVTYGSKHWVNGLIQEWWIFRRPK
jgi:hypothetical protein